MTSKTEQVLQGLVALVAAVRPAAVVDRNRDKPVKPAPGGNVNILDGEPEELDPDFSPLTYNYTHEIEFEVYAPTPETAASIAADIGAGLRADSFLGGLCDHIRPTAAKTIKASTDGVATLTGTGFSVIADYSTQNPLG